MRRGLSTKNLVYNALNAVTTPFSGISTVAGFQAKELSYVGDNRVYEGDVHVLLRDAILVTKAENAASIFIDADAANSATSQAALQGSYTAQDGTLKPGYTASIGDS